MKRATYLIFFLLLACKSKREQKPLESIEGITINGEKILLDEINMANLRTSQITPWFNGELNKINVESEWAKDLKPHTKNLKIKVFMGSWCSDSKRELPLFFKILDAMDFDHNNLRIFAMSEEKTTPSSFEKGLNILYVPTIIFFKNGNEVNRIVESPVKTLESDIEKIIRGQPYNHSYNF